MNIGAQSHRRAANADHREQRANRTKRPEGAEQQANDREQQANDREQQANDREQQAERREQQANGREQLANDRELLADERERLLDERQQLVKDHQDWEDIRETLTDARELALEGQASPQVTYRDRDRLPEDLSWATAATVSQLGELTARWLTGGLAEHPCCDGHHDPAAHHLRELLAAVNRRGLVTDFGQPGFPHRSDGWVQRAAVTGYCTQETCRELIDALATTDLVVLTEHRPTSTEIPVTLHDGAPYTYVGGRPDTSIWAAAISATSLAALATSWYVCVVDGVWGRNDYLWPALAACLDIPVKLGVAACAPID